MTLRGEKREEKSRRSSWLRFWSSSQQESKACNFGRGLEEIRLLYINMCDFDVDVDLAFHENYNGQKLAFSEKRSSCQG